MNIYTFVGVTAVVIFAIAGIILLAIKCLDYAARAVEQANKRAERAYQEFLRKEKEECEKCLAEFYKD